MLGVRMVEEHLAGEVVEGGLQMVMLELLLLLQLA